MKILVLMPCDERMTYVAAEIYKNLPNNVKDVTFSMPMFMDYLVSSKIVGNWVVAFYDALISMNRVYKASGKENLIVFGTAPKDLKFDVVFSFQDADQTLSYKDVFLEKIKEMVVEDELLASKVAALYSVDDVKYALTDCSAAAEFLASYLKSNEKLEEFYEKYKDKFKEDDKNGTSVQSPSKKRKL